MKTLWQDLRYGVRMLLKSPGFTIVAVLALALGIGANTAIFSVVNAVLLRPLPYAKPDELVRVYATDAKKGRNDHPTSFLNFTDWRNENQVFERMAAFDEASVTLTGGDAPEQLRNLATSADLFPLLGVQPRLGRYFSAPEEQPGGAPVAVLSHGVWQRRFGSDPNIVGRQITLDGESTTVLGVMPPGFAFPLDGFDPEVFSPLDSTAKINTERGARYLRVVARLKPTATLTQAQVEMDTIASRQEEQYAANNTGRGIRLVSLFEDTVGVVRPALLVLLGAVGCVLLIACANVANLLLARAAGRSREIAVRTALGASRLRIVRQLLTESLLLSVLGGGLGLLLALWGVDLLVSMIPAGAPRVGEIGLDGWVLCFTMGISILTGVLFGLAPTLQASKLDLHEALKEGSRGSTEGGRRSRVRGALVISEIALSLMLLVGAGLLIKSFQRLRETDPGFRPDNVLALRFVLPETKYETADSQAAFYRQLLERVAASPGVEAVGVVDPLPLSGDNRTTSFLIENRPPVAPSDLPNVNVRKVSPDYLRAMGIPLLKGRAFTKRDSKDAPRVMLVNETLVRRLFPGEDPLGQRVRFGKQSVEIVGVVGDVKHRSLDVESGGEYYVPYLQSPEPEMSLLARTMTSDPTSLVAAVRGAVREIDKDLPIANISTMNQFLAVSVAPQRFNTLLLGIFAFAALALASIGIFGVMNYTVTQRTHEIGIRMALGAQTTDVLRLIVMQGMTLALIGVSIGLAGSLAATRLLRSLLYGVSATDPLIFFGVSLLLSIVALLACYIPARRATKVDPLIALRYE